LAAGFVEEIASLGVSTLVGLRAAQARWSTTSTSVTSWSWLRPA